MKRFKVIRWIITMSCVAVGLMGISYAYFTEKLTISSKIEAANMKYYFSEGGDILNVTLDPGVTFHLLNLPQNETYTLTYSLKSNDINVPLKRIVDKKIGSITIDLKGVITKQDNRQVEISSLVYNSIPNSLGIFDCYHDFDGVNGTIKLIKQSEPSNLNFENLVINKNVLTIEEQKQLGIEEPLEEQIIIDHTIEQKEANNMQPEEKMEIVETIQVEEELKERAIITIEATYGFEIPLAYDQFNANEN